MTAAALLDDLMRAFTVPDPANVAQVPPAKAANPANRKQWPVLNADIDACEALRIPANPEQAASECLPDSQTFAGVRKAPNRPESEQVSGLSQDSQNSQGWAATMTTEADLAAVAWTDADIARFLARRDRLMRWGWSETEAEALAERLVLRDRDADSRVSCTECRHYSPGSCANHRRAGISAPYVGRDLAGMLQRCPGFQVEGKAT